MQKHKCKKKVRCEFCCHKIKLYKSAKHQEKCEVLQKILNPEPELQTCPHCHKAYPSFELPDHIYAHELLLSSTQVVNRSASIRSRADSRNLNSRILEIIRERNNHIYNRVSIIVGRRGSAPPKNSNIPKPDVAKRLPVSKFEGECQLVCTICLSSVKKGKRVKTLPCFHQFHKRCIDTWLENSPLCPICKVSL